MAFNSRDKPIFLYTDNRQQLQQLHKNITLTGQVEDKRRTIGQKSAIECHVLKKLENEISKNPLQDLKAIISLYVGGKKRGTTGSRGSYLALSRFGAVSASGVDLKKIDGIMKTGSTIRFDL